MKVCGLEKLFYVINKVLARPFEIFILTCWLLSATSLSPIDSQKLNELLNATFNPNTPGLATLKTKLDEQGFAFEAETALILAQQGEEVVGFDLDIAFKEGAAVVMLDGNLTQLASTEFDIIANNALECKSGETPQLIDQDITQYDHCTRNELRHQRAKIHSILKQTLLSPEIQAQLMYELHIIFAQDLLKQFKKEQAMLAWCKELNQEINAHQVNFGFTYSSKQRPYVIINGPAIHHHAIAITSTWFNSDNAQDCIERFKALINLLANKKSKVIFKKSVTPAFGQALHDAHISFEDNTTLTEENALTMQNPYLPVETPASL